MNTAIMHFSYSLKNVEFSVGLVMMLNSKKAHFLLFGVGYLNHISPLCFVFGYNYPCGCSYILSVCMCDTVNQLVSSWTSFGHGANVLREDLLLCVKWNLVDIEHIWAGYLLWKISAISATLLCKQELLIALWRYVWIFIWQVILKIDFVINALKNFPLEFKITHDSTSKHNRK